MVEENIFINILVKGAELDKAAFSELESSLNTTLTRLNQSQSGFTKFSRGLNQFTNAALSSREEIANFGKTASSNFTLATRAGMKFAKIGQAINDFFSQFQAWAMSIMFFGMFIQRTFQNIMKTGVAAFTKVMETSNIFGTNIQRLGMWWDYLKFTIGSAINTALAPLMPMLISLIKHIADWISTHKELVGKLIVFGIVLGTLMFMFGTLILGIFGIIKGVLMLGSALKWLGSHPIMILIMYIIYLIARYNSLKGAWADLVVIGLRVFKYLVKGFIDLVWAIVWYMLWLTQQLIKLWGFIVKLPLRLVGWLVPKLLELWGWLFKKLVNLLIEANGWMWKALLQLAQYFGVIWWGIKKVTSEVWNGIIEGLERAINWILQKAQWWIDRWNDIRRAFGKEPLDIKLPKLNFDSAKWQVESFQDFWEKSSKELSQNQATIDAAVNVTKGVADAFIDTAVQASSTFVENMMQGAENLVDTITNAGAGFMQKVKDGWTSIMASVETKFLNNVDEKIAEWNEVKEAYTKPEFQAILDMGGMIGSGLSALAPTMGELSDATTSLVDELKSWKSEESTQNVLGSKQFGGIIPKSGLYNLHAGETVVPSNNFGGITVNINAPGADTKTIVRQIENELRMAIRRFNS